MSLFYRQITTPVGNLQLLAQEDALLAILWPHQRLESAQLEAIVPRVDCKILQSTEEQLKQYFMRQRQTFTIPLKIQGTPLQMAAWQALMDIPYGQTCSYSQLAAAIDRPKAVRAIGSAIGRNRFSILLPCHRVIGIKGNLAGFAGGIDNKQKLLHLEADVRLTKYVADQ